MIDYNTKEGEKVSEVHFELVGLRTIVEQIKRAIMELRKRIEPILKMDTPCETEVPQSRIEENIVPLANEIRNIRTALSKYNEDLIQIVRECEL